MHVLTAHRSCMRCTHVQLCCVRPVVKETMREDARVRVATSCQIPISCKNCRLAADSLKKSIGKQMPEIDTVKESEDYGVGMCMVIRRL